MESKVSPKSTRTLPTDHTEDPVEHAVNKPKNMGTHNPPNNHESPFEPPEASLSIASRVMATGDALVELIKVISIQGKVLKDLQAANVELYKQLETVSEKLYQLELRFHASRGAQTTEPMLKHKFDSLDSDKTTIDEQLLDSSSDIESFIFTHPSALSFEPSNTLSSEYIDAQGMAMSSLATTLALAPQLPTNTSLVSSRSSVSSFRERRPFKPHREEHVKRSRVTYDGKGGQTPNISPPFLSCDDDGAAEDVQQNVQDTSNAQSPGESVSSGEDSEEDTECDGPSLTSWLYVKATKALFGQ